MELEIYEPNYIRIDRQMKIYINIYKTELFLASGGFTFFLFCREPAHEIPPMTRL